MQKYIGTKIVQATPAILKGGKVYLPTDAIPKTLDRVEQGYKVVYEDGYESWSPKDVFEKAYRIAETPLDRMYIEYNDLLDKSNKLSLLLGREDKEKIDGDLQCELMELQRAHMKGYLLVLRLRIELMKK